MFNALVTRPKKWAEPGPRPNLNLGTVKISRLGHAFSTHYHTDFFEIWRKCVRMDQGGTYTRRAHRLRVACTLLARLPCRAQPWPTRGTPVAHPWPTHGPGVAQAWPRRRTGLVWAPPRRDVLTGGKTGLAKVFILN